MDIDKIMKNVKIYNFLIGTDTKKSILLSNDNSLDKAKKELMKKVKPNLKIFKGILITKLKIEKVPPKIIELDKKSKLKLIGGPILIKLSLYKVGKNGNMSLQKTGSNKIFITTKYLNKHKKILEKDIRYIVYAFRNDMLSDALFAVNTIDKIEK